MGHLINPLSFRLGINFFWTSTWNTTNFHKYNHVFISDKYIIDYITWSLKKMYDFKFKLEPFKVKIFRANEKIFISIYNQYLGNFLSHNSEWFKFKPNNIYKISYHILYKIILSYFWEIFNKKVQFFLRKANNIKHLSFFLNVYYGSKHTVDPKLITDNIIKRLNSGFSLPQVINPVTWNLEKKIGESFISGYKLLYAGRFTRKQIATFSWISRGYLKLNSPSTVVKYSSGRTILKFGACGIKLWLTFKDKNNYIEGFDLIYPFNKSCYNVQNKKTKNIFFWNLFFGQNTLNFYKNNKSESYFKFLKWNLNKNIHKTNGKFYKITRNKNSFNLNCEKFINLNYFEYRRLKKKKKKKASFFKPIHKPIEVWKGKIDSSLKSLIISNYKLRGRLALFYISKKSSYFPKLLQIKYHKGLSNSNLKQISLIPSYE